MFSSCNTSVSLTRSTVMSVKEVLKDLGAEDSQRSSRKLHLLLKNKEVRSWNMRNKMWEEEKLRPKGKCLSVFIFLLGKCRSKKLKRSSSLSIQWFWMSFSNETQSYFQKRFMYFIKNGGLDRPQIFEYTEGVISRSSCADYKLRAKCDQAGEQKTFIR